MDRPAEPGHDDHSDVPGPEPFHLEGRPQGAGPAVPGRVELHQRDPDHGPGPEQRHGRRRGLEGSEPLTVQGAGRWAKRPGTDLYEIIMTGSVARSQALQSRISGVRHWRGTRFSGIGCRSNVVRTRDLESPRHDLLDEAS